MSNLTDEQKATVWNKFFAPNESKGASADDARWFEAQCERRGFSPLDGVLIPSWYGGKMSIITTIEAMRIIASRTKEYQGQGPIEFTADGEKWTSCWLHREPPVAARASVHRLGFVEPLTRVVRWADYVVTGRDGKPSAMWMKMAPTMIGKCAEVAALRAAFPEADGLYIGEEMEQADDKAGNKTPARNRGAQLAEQSKSTLDEVMAKGKATKPAPEPEREATEPSSMPDPAEPAELEVPVTLGPKGAEQLLKALHGVRGDMTTEDMVDVLSAFLEHKHKCDFVDQPIADWPDTPELRSACREFIKEARKHN